MQNPTARIPSPTTDLGRRDRSSLISVVVPAFNEEGNLAALYDAIRAALETLEWELVFVDDGSTDHTFDVIRELAQRDDRVRGLGLSRNFGHQYALLAGLKASRGLAVVTMDADLQHPPALIPRLLAEWQHGVNIVHTRRASTRETGWFKRTSSSLYYRLFSLLSGVPLEEGLADFRLLDRGVVAALTDLEEVQLFLRGLVRWVGFRQTIVPYEAHERHSGEPKYDVARMLSLAADGVTSFSTAPLRLGIFVGFLTSAGAFVEILYILWITWSGDPVPGWASVAGLVALLFGINFILLGFLGIYIGHIFTRVQRHPAYLIERTTEVTDTPGAAAESVAAPRPSR